MFFDDVVSDGQTQPSTHTDPFGRKTGVEYFRKLLGWNPTPVVGYSHHDFKNTLLTHGFQVQSVASLLDLFDRRALEREHRKLSGIEEVGALDVAIA